VEVCKRCGAELPDGANFCPACGRAVVIKHGPKKRGNGQGTIKALDNGKYMLTVTLGYYTDEQGKRHRRTRSRVYGRKKDAVAAVPVLLADPRKEVKKATTFKQLYDAWLPTHRAGKSTLGNYKAAMAYFEPIWHMRISEIDVDDLQECMDETPGKCTQQNMKAVCGLLYKYAIPRNMATLNMGPYLVVGGEDGLGKEGLPLEALEKLKNRISSLEMEQEDLMFKVCM
jgi:hypothetical protein